MPPDLDGALRDLTRFLSREIPYYSTGGETFDQLPVVTKSIMRGRIRQFVARRLASDPARLIDFLESPNGDGSTDIPFGEGIVVEQTSGTSGTPFRIAKLQSERIRASVGIWRYRRQIDRAVSSSSLLALIHGPPNKGRTGLSELTASLATGRVRWLHAGPRMLSNLLPLLQDATKSPASDLRFVESSSQHLDASLRQALQSKLKVGVIDQYGCREVSVIGHSVSGEGFVPLQENTFVELLDERDHRIAGPGVPGRVVVTSLHARLMPFVRYDTGDRGEWAVVDQQLRLRLVPFRPQHLIVGSDSVSGTALFKDILASVYARIGFAAVDYIQIRQLDRDRFEIRMNAHPQVDRIRRLVEDMFNHSAILRWPAAFTATLADEDEIRHADDRKIDLFTNVVATAATVPTH